LIAKAKYRGVANVVAETAWVRNLLCELHPVQLQRTKHIELIFILFVILWQKGLVHVMHVPTRFQYANIFTKDLSSSLLQDFRYSLNV
jgi:hypothetical protein